MGKGLPVSGSKAILLPTAVDVPIPNKASTKDMSHCIGLKSRTKCSTHIKQCKLKLQQILWHSAFRDSCLRRHLFNQITLRDTEKKKAKTNSTSNNLVTVED